MGDSSDTMSKMAEDEEEIKTKNIREIIKIVKYFSAHVEDLHDFKENFYNWYQSFISEWKSCNFVEKNAIQCMRPAFYIHFMLTFILSFSILEHCRSVLLYDSDLSYLLLGPSLYLVLVLIQMSPIIWLLYFNQPSECLSQVFKDLQQVCSVWRIFCHRIKTVQQTFNLDARRYDELYFDAFDFYETNHATFFITSVSLYKNHGMFLAMPVFTICTYCEFETFDILLCLSIGLAIFSVIEKTVFSLIFLKKITQKREEMSKNTEEFISWFNGKCEVKLMLYKRNIKTNILSVIPLKKSYISPHFRYVNLINLITLCANVFHSDLLEYQFEVLVSAVVNGHYYILGNPLLSKMKLDLMLLYQISKCKALLTNSFQNDIEAVEEEENAEEIALDSDCFDASSFRVIDLKIIDPAENSTLETPENRSPNEHNSYFSETVSVTDNSNFDMKIESVEFRFELPGSDVPCISSTSTFKTSKISTPSEYNSQFSKAVSENDNSNTDMNVEYGLEVPGDIPDQSSEDELLNSLAFNTKSIDGSSDEEEIIPLFSEIDDYIIGNLFQNEIEAMEEKENTEEIGLDNDCFNTSSFRVINLKITDSTENSTIETPENLSPNKYNSCFSETVSETDNSNTDMNVEYRSEVLVLDVPDRYSEDELSNISAFNRKAIDGSSNEEEIIPLFSEIDVCSFDSDNSKNRDLNKFTSDFKSGTELSTSNNYQPAEKNLDFNFNSCDEEKIKALDSGKNDEVSFIQISGNDISMEEEFQDMTANQASDYKLDKLRNIAVDFFTDFQENGAQCVENQNLNTDVLSDVFGHNLYYPGEEVMQILGLKLKAEKSFSFNSFEDCKTTDLCNDAVNFSSVLEKSEVQNGIDRSLYPEAKVSVISSTSEQMRNKPETGLLNFTTESDSSVDTNSLVYEAYQANTENEKSLHLNGQGSEHNNKTLAESEDLFFQIKSFEECFNSPYIEKVEKNDHGSNVLLPTNVQEYLNFSTILPSYEKETVSTNCDISQITNQELNAPFSTGFTSCLSTPVSLQTDEIENEISCSRMVDTSNLKKDQAGINNIQNATDQNLPTSNDSTVKKGRDINEEASVLHSSGFELFNLKTSASDDTENETTCIFVLDRSISENDPTIKDSIRNETQQKLSSYDSTIMNGNEKSFPTQSTSNEIHDSQINENICEKKCSLERETNHSDLSKKDSSQRNFNNQRNLTKQTSNAVLSDENSKATNHVISTSVKSEINGRRIIRRGKRCRKSNADRQVQDKNDRQWQEPFKHGTTENISTASPSTSSTVNKCILISSHDSKSLANDRQWHESFSHRTTENSTTGSPSASSTDFPSTSVTINKFIPGNSHDSKPLGNGRQRHEPSILRTTENSTSDSPSTSSTINKFIPGNSPDRESLANDRQWHESFSHGTTGNSTTGSSSASSTDSSSTSVTINKSTLGSSHDSKPLGNDRQWHEPSRLRTTENSTSDAPSTSTTINKFIPGNSPDRESLANDRQWHESFSHGTTENSTTCSPSVSTAYFPSTSVTINKFIPGRSHDSKPLGNDTQRHEPSNLITTKNSTLDSPPTSSTISKYFRGSHDSNIYYRTHLIKRRLKHDKCAPLSTYCEDSEIEEAQGKTFITPKKRQEMRHLCLRKYRITSPNDHDKSEETIFQTFPKTKHNISAAKDSVINISGRGKTGVGITEVTLYQYTETKDQESEGNAENLKDETLTNQPRYLLEMPRKWTSESEGPPTGSSEDDHFHFHRSTSAYSDSTIPDSSQTTSVGSSVSENMQSNIKDISIDESAVEYHDASTENILSSQMGGLARNRESVWRSDLYFDRSEEDSSGNRTVLERKKGSKYNRDCSSLQNESTTDPLEYHLKYENLDLNVLDSNCESLTIRFVYENEDSSVRLPDSNLKAWKSCSSLSSADELLIPTEARSQLRGSFSSVHLDDVHVINNAGYSCLTSEDRPVFDGTTKTARRTASNTLKSATEDDEKETLESAHRDSFPTSGIISDPHEEVFSDLLVTEDTLAKKSHSPLEELNAEGNEVLDASDATHSLENISPQNQPCCKSIKKLEPNPIETREEETDPKDFVFESKGLRIKYKPVCKSDFVTVSYRRQKGSTKMTFKSKEKKMYLKMSK